MKLKKKIIKFITVIMVISFPLTTIVKAEDKQTRATSAPIEINETNFPDENFRNAIQGFLDLDYNGSLSEQEINAATTVEMSNKSISNFKGIEYFTAMTTFYCDETRELTSLDISKNTALKKLYCGGTNLTKLDLSKNTALRYLDFYELPITTLDLSNNTALKDFYCVDSILISLHLPNNLSFDNFIIRSQRAKDIYIDSKGNFDLSTLDSKIDVNKISNLSSGVTINGTVLSGLQNGDQVQYTYDCGSGQSLSASLKVIDQTYKVVVNDGTGSKEYNDGETVTIKADAPSKGKQFKEWQINSGSITLTDKNSATTTFTMPAESVEVTAIYEDALYPVVVNGGTGSNDYKMDDIVTIEANAPALGKQFKEWQIVSGGITLDNPKDATTTFKMPTENVEVTAIYEDVTITDSNSDSTYQIGSGKNLIYKCSSLLEDFVGIYMDNELIDGSHYTLKSGSTIVTLDSGYLDTLTVGKHTIRFEYKDGVIAETELIIKAKATEIKPEDKPSNPAKPEEPITPESKPDTTPENKPSETTPDTSNDTVKTSDQTNMLISSILLIMSGIVLIGLRKNIKNLK